MKNIMTIAVLALATASEAAVFKIYNCRGCNCPSPGTINVQDNKCLLTNGFQSVSLLNNGGANQQVTFYSPHSCNNGGVITQRCVAGRNSVPINQCFDTVNSSGGSNAASSASNAGACPN